jgi:hypothetical protein
LPKTFKISYAVFVNSVDDDDMLYNKRQIKYLTDTQSVHYYKQLMWLIELYSFYIYNEDYLSNKSRGIFLYFDYIIFLLF